MPAIIVRNTRGNTVATVNPQSVNTATPLSFVGQGYPGYSDVVYGTIYSIAENFASDSAPAAPIEGQDWYAPTEKQMRYYNGTAWVDYAGASNNSGAMLSRMVTASNINFNAAASHNLHTGATGLKTYVTGVMVIPQSGASVAGANVPSFRLEVTASTGDVMDKVTLLGMTSAASFGFFPAAGVNRIVQAGEVVKLAIDTAISGGDTLVCDVYLFGTVR